ncbi:hypothetical protein VPH35_097959 [Triticum aestivum]
MILRDHNSHIIFSAYHVIFHCNDSLEAKLHVIMQGMALAIQHSSLPVIVQSDSSEALSCLLHRGLESSAYGHLVREIKELLFSREFYPQKNLRSQNSVADRLANYSRTKSTTVVWLTSAPPSIEELWHLDCNATTE